MIKIVPAILAKSYEEFEMMVRRIEPYADLVHLDIADGEFVPNKTIEGIEELKKINTKLNFEVHLMVKEPEKKIDNWLDTKAVRYLIHWESTDEFEGLLDKIHSAGKEFGAVLNPLTTQPAESLASKVDLVQFMTVNPGFYGSPFLPEVLEKIKNFRVQYLDKKIQVDGGINPETLKLVQTAGADCAVVGSYILGSDNIKETLEKLKNV